MIKDRLHTDGLENRYGPVTATVLEHSDDRRVIDIVDAEGISRTHCVTWYPEVLEGDDEVKNIRREVAEGALVGKTFQNYGYTIDKEQITSGIIVIPEWLRGRFNVEDREAHFAIYNFLAIKASATCLYGTICEIYSPDFRSVDHTDEVAKDLDNDAEMFVEALHQYLKEEQL